jgi:hypothetical protein
MNVLHERPPIGFIATARNAVTPTVRLEKADRVVSFLVKYYENSSFFWTLSGAVNPSPIIGFRCQVSGFRPTLAFSLLTPDT